MTAVLTDNKGEPILGMPIAFNVNTTFGVLRIGAPYTDKNGMAKVNYTTTKEGILEFAASFPGGGGYEGSTSQVTRRLLTVSTATVSPFTPSGIAITLVVVVALSIWGLYVYVLSQLRGISKEGKTNERGDS